MAKTEFVKAFEKARKIVEELDTAMIELQYEMEQALPKAYNRGWSIGVKQGAEKRAATALKKAKSAAAGSK